VVAHSTIPAGQDYRHTYEKPSLRPLWHFFLAGGLAGWLAGAQHHPNHHSFQSQSNPITGQTGPNASHRTHTYTHAGQQERETEKAKERQLQRKEERDANGQGRDRRRRCWRRRLVLAWVCCGVVRWVGLVESINRFVGGGLAWCLVLGLCGGVFVGAVRYMAE